MTAFVLAALWSVITFVFGLLTDVGKLLRFFWTAGSLTKGAVLIAASGVVCTVVAYFLGNPWYFPYLSLSSFAHVLLATLAIRYLDTP